MAAFTPLLRQTIPAQEKKNMADITIKFTTPKESREALLAIQSEAIYRAAMRALGYLNDLVIRNELNTTAPDDIREAIEHHLEWVRDIHGRFPPSEHRS